jgi:hypothetical protein
LALQLGNQDGIPEARSMPDIQAEDRSILEWMSTAAESQYAGTLVDFSDDETEAGPSTTYAERQADVLQKLKKRSKCSVCLEDFPSGATVVVPCNDHRYCTGCLREIFIRATKDETYFPPRCCKTSIPLQMISKYLSTEDLAAFELASVEFTTQNRVYCSNRECGRFVLPNDIEPGTQRALCPYCHTSTCALCKHDYHEGIDCPDDPSLRETRELARQMGWQSCYRCGSIVMLRTGCNHMT